MTPEETAAIAEIETENQKLGTGAFGRFSARIPWLIALVRRLDTRVSDLESGDIPEVIARKDAEIAQLGTALGVAGENIRHLEERAGLTPEAIFATEIAERRG